jgi:hypothetical protein
MIAPVTLTASANSGLVVTTLNSQTVSSQTLTANLGVVPRLLSHILEHVMEH